MPSFADLVFHVLAHVRPERPMNASVFDSSYVEFCRGHLGPVGERRLSEDAAALASVLKTHERLARVQLLAWCFETPEAAAKWDAVECSEVKEGALPEVLGRWGEAERNALELLRCAVALEREHWERLPAVREGDELRSRVQQVREIAPRLTSIELGQCRALGRRGRAFRQSVLVGMVGAEPFRVTAEHAAMQAAHEATVLEVQGEGRLSFLEVEHTALVLLRERARGTKLEEEHGRWLTGHELSDFGGLEGISRERLAAGACRLIERLR